MERHENLRTLVDLVQVTKNFNVRWKAEEVIEAILWDEVKAIRKERHEEQVQKTMADAASK